MPKARQTCTRCSMRRQKCDRKEPCTRCIAAGEAHRCTRVWVGGYDANVHRQYPQSETKYRRRPSAAESTSRSSANNSTIHDNKHDSNLRPPSLDSDSDGWSSEHDRRSISGGGVEYDASIEDFLWSPDPLCRAIISGSSDTVYSGAAFTRRNTDPRLRNPSFAEDTQKLSLELQEVSYLENALPNGLQILQLVEYHAENLLWCTHCYHGPTFRREVTHALQTGGGRISIRDQDLRWCALLFAVLTSSLCSASEAAAQKWGFTSEQRISISKKWFEASMECLSKAEYLTKPHPSSVQAILLLVGPSLVLGLSHRQSSMLGGALKIASSLGLDRLPHRPEYEDSSVSEEASISREVGRRTWWSLVSHDWTSIASYDMFSIDPNHFTTTRPQSYNTGPLKGPDPLADVQNHVLDIAKVVMEFHVTSTACSDSVSEYEQVWKHDQRLRELSRKDLCLEDWPLPWCFWAKQLIRMKLAHKIIDIHRNFFDRSFRDSKYAWSRWASVEAAKTIVQEAETALNDPARPVTWTDQAHLMIAGITLSKVIVKRTEEAEREEHVRLLQRAMALLRRYDDSALANRAHKYLSSFLEESVGSSRRNSPDPTWFQMAPGFRTPDSSMFGAPRYTLTTTTSSMPLDPELDGLNIAFTTAGNSATTLTTAPGAFDLPSISVNTVPNDPTWVDMMPAFPQDRMGMGNLMGFDDPYNGF